MSESPANTRAMMKKLIRNCAATIGWRLPLGERLAPRGRAALVYHGIPCTTVAPQVDARTFESHVAFLVEHFEMVAPEDGDKRRPARAKIQVLLTFDDGFRNNAEIVAPILRRYRVPAVFFVCTRHAEPGKYLWFSYLKMLERCFKGNGFIYEGELMDMSPGERRKTMRKLEQHLLSLKPHPAKMYEVIDEQLPRLEDFASEAEINDCCAGMTAEQIEELAACSLFTVGVHTADHPMLTMCEPQEAARQIGSNKEWIEKLIKRRCDLIAYPNADYDENILAQCRALGINGGYTANRSLKRDPQLEVKRVGIYARPTIELGFKVRWGGMMRL